MTATYRAHANAIHEATGREARARERIQAIARQLVAAGYRPDCFLQEGKRWKNLLFGGRKQVRDRSADVYGWFVGEYLWDERQAGMYGGDRKTESRAKTYVTSGGSITKEGTGWYSENELSNVGYPFWEEIASKMIAIAQQHGLRVP